MTSSDHIRFTRRSVLAVSASLAAELTVPSALAQTVGAPPARPRGQVIAGLSQEPTIFHPLMPMIEVDQGVWWNLFSTLWYVDPAGRLVPDLAREVPTPQNGGISADGLTWKIKLRKDAKWHDGQPFTADDVKFTIELINNTAFRARTRVGHNVVKDIRVVAPDEIHWKMDKVFSPYVFFLAQTFMVPKHILEKASDPNSSPFNNSPIGTGPFRWDKRVPGDNIQLVANPTYHGKGPYLERIVFKYIPDLTVLYTQFRTGQVDYLGLAGILPNFVKEAQGLKDRRVVLSPAASVEHVALNQEFGPFRDKAVREAMYMAINKKAIIDVVYYGIPIPTESFLPNLNWAYKADLPAQTYDPAKANALLDAAGWKRGAGGIREKAGVRLEFTNSTTVGNAAREQVQQLLMQDFKTIGAAMTINNLPPAVIWGEYWQKSKFQSVIISVVFPTSGDPDVTARFASDQISAKGGQGYNTIQYQNPEVDKLLAEGTSQFDLAKRKNVYGKIQSIIRNDYAILPLFQDLRAEGLKAGLQGYSSNLNVLSNCWNMREWYWAT
jgi:peptide/nickel transport system substrate-binding protein